MKKLLLTFAVAALAIASAETFKVNLYQASYLGDKELTPGAYKLEVTEGKVVFSRSKESAEAQVKAESAGSKFKTTFIRYSNGDGKFRIQEICLGGTDTKLVVN